jgi:hypothetical protein
VVRWASKCGASSDFITFSVWDCALEATQASPTATAQAIPRIVASRRYVSIVLSVTSVHVRRRERTARMSAAMYGAPGQRIACPGYILP